ncbi:MAG: septation protein IspZ, partial [Alphaproteobacteria bacterium]|nr:septation protein IspZ [Alphaproteobacteria bacterium]
EAVWRNTSTAIWVDFKVFAILPLIFLFAIAQTPLVLRHQIVKDGPKTDS